MKKVILLLFVCLFVFSGCAKEECTVTFDTQGGSAVERQVVVKGDKVKEPPIPTKECECVFDGWYVGDEKWSFIGYSVTEDMTLTAKWVDCFGLSAKEIESIEDFITYYEYTWGDIENIEKEDPYITDSGRVWEDSCEYRITLKNGKKYSIALQKE